ncbi:DNRLRE domain-containing protein [Thalassomonas haliotis]|uniref:DNRLRE domain-containing protein n=1 Tax=Thalassomonas haliotis TaxID=485448 RepID=A0ABY7VHF1_9GAMM|nr:DNRLRE domain-containing protein [Thalassomonas haliotis]WDE12475.1 DNRLRE domain-containing protein [Thalassomonas haliotis]
MKKGTLTGLILASGLLSLSSAQADTKHHRLMWDADPASNAVIGFSPDGSSQSPYVKFGYGTDESLWTRAPVSASFTFDNALTSHFVRLSGLNANSPVYYRVCDQNGCGDRLWFKTAPTDNSPYTVIAGGDTRTGWTNRRAGNELLAKIRPLFVMHGGDYTNANSASEMNQYLEDWQLSFSHDTIDGLPYKRIYPMVATHGNHEDDNYSTLCQVFGVDYNEDGQCNALDTYGAFNVSPLLRVYTLNSQFKNSGWSSYASAMNSWLSNDLSTQGSSATWRFAQYHKPMYPHYTGKSENTELFDWWAQDFYDHALNLVVESDTHINKLTKAIKPSGNGFSETTSGGTVYVGEGSWGAPARSANDPKSWTLDLASIQQFKVISVEGGQLTVRTAQFTSSAGTLTREQRAADALALPPSVDWWHANGIGEQLKLVQNSDRRSVIDSGATGNSMTLNASDDTFIAKSKADTNYNGSSDGLLADGLSSTYGEMQTLIKFDLSQLPACSTVTSASLKLNVFNSSSGSYNIYNGKNSWHENNATWNSVSGDGHQGTQLGSFTASSTGEKTISLGQAGLDAVNAWQQGNNNGLVIASGGTANGIDMNSKEMGSGPQLLLAYQQGSDCGGLSESDLAAEKGSWLHYSVDVPAGMSSLQVTIAGGSGDADLYVRKGSQPTSSDYDCRPWVDGNTESCSQDNPEAATWFISIYGYSDFSGLSLNARWQP